MDIALITTRESLEENERLKVEAENLGHTFSVLNFRNFEYGVVNDVLEVPLYGDIKPDIIIVRGVFNSIKATSTFIKGLRAQGVKVFDNNFLEHRYSINKVADVMKLAQAGIPLPDTFHLHSYENFVSSAKRIGFPVICKLTRTGKGARVFKFDNEADLQNFISDCEERGTDPRSYMLQKFIDYVHDLRILIIGEHMFCMKRIPGEGEFRANFSLGGSVELFELDEAGRKMAVDALHAVDLSIGGVDMLITDKNERYILEVNHTAGFIGMELAASQNIGKIWIEHAIENAF